jgi:hypothetical protein
MRRADRWLLAPSGAVEGLTGGDSPARVAEPIGGSHERDRVGTGGQVLALGACRPPIANGVQLQGAETDACERIVLADDIQRFIEERLMLRSPASYRNLAHGPGQLIAPTESSGQRDRFERGAPGLVELAAASAALAQSDQRLEAAPVGVDRRAVEHAQSALEARRGLVPRPDTIAAAPAATQACAAMSGSLAPSGDHRLVATGTPMTLRRCSGRAFQEAELGHRVCVAGVRRGRCRRFHFQLEVSRRRGSMVGGMRVPRGSRCTRRLGSSRRTSRVGCSSTPTRAARRTPGCRSGWGC